MTVLVAIVAAALYVGWPVVYDRILVPLQANTADVDALRGQVAELRREVEELRSQAGSASDRLDDVDGRLATLDESIAQHGRTLEALAGMDEKLADADGALAEELSRQVRLLKAMELMSRARLFMYESNFGAARQDLLAAREILAVIAGTGSPLPGAQLQVAVERLDRTLEALPDFPVVAADDLDIAWQALLGEVPQPTASAVTDVVPPPTESPAESPVPSPGPS